MIWRKRIGIAVLVSGVLAGAAIGAGPALAAPAENDTAGPDLLRAPAVDAPQLQNTGIWEADPIGICMTSAYRSGEYVHQGCNYDDQGGGNQYRWPNDTLLRNYTYPEDPAYRRNAADIVEVRVKPEDDATAFRVTMNTMTDPELLGLTLALGDSDAPREAPHGANTVMPASQFVTVHGTEGDITDAADGRALPDRPQVSVDVERRQVEIRVPHTAWDPQGNQRIAAAAGLWDRDADSYLVPQATADETRPGGAIIGDPTPSAFFDTAFRFREPFEAPYRDNDQKKAIADGDVSPFFADVDFGKLADGTDDESGVPTTGYMTRLFASQFEKAQGRRLPSDPGGPPPGTGTQQGGIATGSGEGSGDKRPSISFGYPCRDDCVPDLPGRLQRYMVYVPEQEAPSDGYSSMVWTGGYALRPGDDVAGDKDLYRKFADRPGNPTMIIDVDFRGADNWGYGEGGAVVFEAMADARRHYALDTEKTTMAGFSSGAYTANKLSLQFPDVFNKSFICDGLNVAPSLPAVNGVADTLPVDTVTKHEPGSKISEMLPSRRNQPVMEWAGVNDDFIPYNITRERAQAYIDGDYDFEFISHVGLGAEHLVMCKNGMWDIATNWLGDQARQVDPQHVTFVRNPLMDDPGAGLVADKAYWLSDIQSRGDELGAVDVVSEGQGRTDPAVAPVGREVKAEEGTFSPVNPYLREFRHSGDAVEAESNDVLDIRSAGVGEITVDPERAGVGCDAELKVATDGPLAVTLAGCDRTETFDGTDSGGLKKPATYDPPDPLEPLGNPLQGAPVPPEVGNLPQPPLQDVPPLRFPPNQLGQDPAPGDGAQENPVPDGTEQG
ncbi:glucodextranase-like protein [Pseudonocardia sediminis]|uniref:Glucodextranase-like protein n=1 Tax=Pseudonocardia sediminis TaxID=1397368 RepID=A0A4Q7V0H6_PSEST|nr:glucodextranase DOMON-like domain-containing protein [Pseudonocardia sediminis]RZT87796.1 glucodextranase-like protein [Pseudonocardia sediminis]